MISKKISMAKEIDIESLINNKLILFYTAVAVSGIWGNDDMKKRGLDYFIGYTISMIFSTKYIMKYGISYRGILMVVLIETIFLVAFNIYSIVKNKIKRRVNKWKYCGMVIPRLKKFDSKTRLKCEIAIIAPSCFHLILGIASLILSSRNQSDFWLLVATINFFMLLQGFYEKK